jgi:WYL_2, Sm-like SH3 beta-barrel fold
MQITDTEFTEFKKWLNSTLKLEKVTVTFLKQDGTERVLKCTTNPMYITVVSASPDEGAEPKKERKVNEDVCPVFDLESNSWKSFRYDSVKRIEFSLTDD